MFTNSRHLRRAACAILAFVFVLAAAGQNRSAQRGATPPQDAARQAINSERDMSANQQQLIKLLRLSPVLTSVVARDPSLLANKEYVAHNNPQLAQFIAAHPEISRNPEFYLFTRLPREMGGGREHALERAVWPEMVQSCPQTPQVNLQDNSQALRNNPQQTIQGYMIRDLLQSTIALVAFATFLGALIWLIRLFVEGRRWNRIFGLQTEVHGRLIDKFSSNQELAAYMETEAGKRFLGAAPTPGGKDAGSPMPNVVARVLTPLQIGIVLALLGAGVIMLPRVGSDMTTLVLGVLFLMPGLGFILSAAITFVLAKRLRLLPEKSDANVAAQDRQ